MKRINHQQIIVPLEFSIACSIYKVSVVEVLQVFIDYVTLYGLIDKTYEEGFSEAIHSVIFCVKLKNRLPQQIKAMRNCKAIFNSCIHQINILARRQNKELKIATKRRYARHAVTAIFEAMERLHTPSDKLYLDEFSCLELSRDFCVVCEIYDCYPKEYLEYFMGKISVADAHAYQWLKLEYNNFIFDFFMKIATGFGRDTATVPKLCDREIDFYEIMAELPLKLYHVRNLHKRVLLLQEFYFSHYQNMNQP